MIKQAQDKIAWSLQTFGVSEENGEVLNDAFYARNQAMMEMYNFKMKVIEIDTYPHSTVRSSVMAGDDEYDAAFIAITHDRALFDGTYFNVYDLPHLELDKAWWNQAMQEALTFGGSLYFLSGDLIVSDDDGLQINIYNKALGEDFKIFRVGKCAALYAGGRRPCLHRNGRLHGTDRRIKPKSHRSRGGFCYCFE